MRRWLARAALLVVLGAILFALYLPRTSTSIWPLGAHAHFIVAYALILTYVVLGSLGLVALGVLIVWLWRRAR